jgi:hypothetical protein
MLAISEASWLALIIAVISIVPSTLAAIFTLIINRKVKTNHGKNIGQHVEDVKETQESLLVLLAEHTGQDAANFAQLRRELADIRGELNAA